MLACSLHPVFFGLDIYTILATTTEVEWGYALKLRDQQEDQPYVMEAGRLVSKHFSAIDRLGMIRLFSTERTKSSFSTIGENI